MPSALLPKRCALTAPFHPYSLARAVYFLWRFPSDHSGRALPGVLFPWSPDFPHLPLRKSAIVRPSDHRAICLLDELRSSRFKAGVKPILPLIKGSQTAQSAFQIRQNAFLTGKSKKFQKISIFFAPEPENFCAPMKHSPAKSKRDLPIQDSLTPKAFRIRTTGTGGTLNIQVYSMG